LFARDCRRSTQRDIGRPFAGTLVDFLLDPALKRDIKLAVSEGSAGLRGALTGLEMMALGGTRRLQSCKIGVASTTHGIRVCQSSRRDRHSLVTPAKFQVEPRRSPAAHSCQEKF